MKGLERAVQIAKHLVNGLPDTVHIGLTGGTLYKEGERKDIDFVIYSHKCFQLIDTQWLASCVSALGFTEIQNFGRVIKCVYKDDLGSTDIDLIIPESQTGEYVEEPPEMVTVTRIHPHNGDEVDIKIPKTPFI